LRCRHATGQGFNKPLSEPIFHDETPSTPLAEVGRYERLQAARERGLVIAAMDRPHWIARQGREYVLCVEEGDREKALAALSEYEREEASRPAPLEVEPLHIPVFAVVMTVLGLILLFAIQSAIPPAWIERGVSDDLRIRAGEWWRTLTALTLHGDTQHLASNLSLGIFISAFMFSRFGVGVGLFATILSGALGNALNVWVHWYQPHRSIGSSTALFAGLGLLAGAELAARLSHQRTRGMWSLIVPLGAGLTFLSVFGGGGVNRDGAPVAEIGRVDVWAHLLGLAAGLLLGIAFYVLGLRRGLAARTQAIFGIGAIGALASAWWMALR
jgi:rhomboid protease GluP